MGCVNAIIRGCLSDDETRGFGFSLVPGVGGFLLMRVAWSGVRTVTTEDCTARRCSP
jgi:hypothetical protein